VLRKSGRSADSLMGPLGLRRDLHISSAPHLGFSTSYRCVSYNTLRPENGRTYGFRVSCWRGEVQVFCCEMSRVGVDCFGNADYTNCKPACGGRRQVHMGNLDEWKVNLK